MRTNGEIERDASIVTSLRHIAEALDKIAGTLAAIDKKLEPPVYLTPKEAMDVVTGEVKA